jgi:hypothetical protein
MYDLYYSALGNETLAIELADAFCFPACAGTGSNNLGGYVGSAGTPFQYYQPQFSSLYGWQSRGNSSYNGLQVSLRHSMASGLLFDLNYTYSKSIDVGSNAERVNGFESGGLAFNSQVINAFSPDLWRAVSDFDTAHQFNANWVWDVPFGHGRHWGGGTNKLVNAVFGGWGLNGLWRWTSGFPFTVNAGAGWATDFELSGTSVLTGAKPMTVWFALADPVLLPAPISAQRCRARQASATSSEGPAISGLMPDSRRRGTSAKQSSSAFHGKFSTLPTPSALMPPDPSSTRIWSTSLVSASSIKPLRAPA